MLLLLPGYFEDKMLENFLKEDDKKKKKKRQESFLLPQTIGGVRTLETRICTSRLIIISLCVCVCVRPTELNCKYITCRATQVSNELRQ